MARYGLLLVLGAWIAVSSAVAEEASVSITLVRDAIVVPVSLNGVGPYAFVLDVRAAQPAVHPDVAEYLKLLPNPDVRVEVKDPAGQPVPARVVRVSELQIGTVSGKDKSLLAMDLTGFKSLLGTPIAGVINPREIAEEFTIDFARSVLILRNGDEANRLSPGDARCVHLDFDEQGAPVVNGLLDGTHARAFLLDTTFPGVIAVPDRILRDAGLLTDDTRRLSVEPAPDAAAASPRQTQVRLRSIRIGGAEVLDPVCAVDASDTATRIGAGFLKKFRVTINSPKQLLELEPAGTAPAHDNPITGCGLTLARFVEGYWTIWVAKDSPAAKAGLVSGGQLLEVDGQDLKDMPYAAVAAKLVRPEGATLAATAMQAGDRRVATLAVQRLL